MGPMSFIKKFIFNLLTIILGLVIVGITVIVFYYLFALIDEKNEILKLEEYKMLSVEEVFKEFEYDRKKYIISTFYDSDSYQYINILLKIKEKYYRLEEIKKCDCSDESIYVKENKIYVHCIGQKGDILEYKVTGTTIEKKILHLNYDKTPNISQIHILIDKVDNNYIYLYSYVKINDFIKEGDKVKCSLKDNVCFYN